MWVVNFSLNFLSDSHQCFWIIKLCAWICSFHIFGLWWKTTNWDGPKFNDSRVKPYRMSLLLCRVLLGVNSEHLFISEPSHGILLVKKLKNITDYKRNYIFRNIFQPNLIFLEGLYLSGTSMGNLKVVAIAFHMAKTSMGGDEGQLFANATQKKTKRCCPYPFFFSCLLKKLRLAQMWPMGQVESIDSDKTNRSV